MGGEEEDNVVVYHVQKDGRPVSGTSPSCPSPFHTLSILGPWMLSHMQSMMAEK